jgi:alpha-D-ribose 1-methylphosphonate 5-triphosphate synthase subunit PhnI
MAYYTTVSGGEEAIRAAERMERAVGGPELGPEAVERRLRYAVDQAMSEAGLYAPKLAALALIEAQGDLAEAAFLLRAYRSTLPKVVYTEPLDVGGMRLIRRVSSVAQDVPGGQVLGPTRDYSQRLLGSKKGEEPSPNGTQDGAPLVRGEGTLPKVTDLLRAAGTVRERRPVGTGGEPFDLTREALRVPAPPSGRLQALARGETGAMGALAYSLLRGFGAAHPVLAEFRVGHLPVRIEHPHTGEAVEVGEILCTEAETVGSETDHGSTDREEGEEESPEAVGAAMRAGYGLVFGRCERKAISMAVLDLAIRAGKERSNGSEAPAEDEEFVLLHTDGVEIGGLIEHLKLPHYVTFQSSLDRLREVRRKAAENGEG